MLSHIKLWKIGKMISGVAKNLRVEKESLLQLSQKEDILMELGYLEYLFLHPIQKVT